VCLPDMAAGRLKETVPVRLHHFRTLAEVTVNHDQIPNHGEGRLCVVREQCPNLLRANRPATLSRAAV